MKTRAEARQEDIALSISLLNIQGEQPTAVAQGHILRSLAITMTWIE